METEEGPGYAERDDEPVSPPTGGGVHHEDVPIADEPDTGDDREDDDREGDDVDLTA